MSSKVFHVAVFEDEQSTAVVPDVWLRGSRTCLWPPYKTSLRINTAVQREEIPGECWSSHKIRLLYSGSLENARKNLNRSEETSDLQSDVEPPSKRQKLAPRRLISEEGETSSDATDEEEQVSPVQAETRRVEKELPLPPQRIEIASASVAGQPRGSSACSPNIQTPASGRVNRIQEVRDTRMFTMLESLQEQMREQTRLLRLLVSRSAQVEESAPNRLPDGISFPLKTVEEMEVFENCMLNQQSASSVVKYLAEYGGSNVQETVARILKTVLATDLARKYNFKGTKGKRKFEGLSLNNIIYRCLHMNPATRSCNRKDLEVAVQKWLFGARDRDGGRKERMRVVPATVNDDDSQG